MMRGRQPAVSGLHVVVLGLAASLAALAAGVVGPSTALACTTALPPLPLADYQAASPVVLGTVEEVGPLDLTVRIAVVYRGRVGSRLRLPYPGPVDDWCAFPWGPPAVGARVLVAVVNQHRWEWPNSGIWTVDGQGRILSPPAAPWSGATAPATVEEALRTMGITLPSTTVVAPPSTPSGEGPFGTALLLAGLGGIIAFALGWRRAAGRCGSGGAR